MTQTERKMRDDGTRLTRRGRTVREGHARPRDATPRPRRVVVDARTTYFQSEGASARTRTRRTLEDG